MSSGGSLGNCQKPVIISAREFKELRVIPEEPKSLKVTASEMKTHHRDN
jgi:hypothetical protein